MMIIIIIVVIFFSKAWVWASGVLILNSIHPVAHLFLGLSLHFPCNVSGTLHKHHTFVGSRLHYSHNTGNKHLPLRPPATLEIARRRSRSLGSLNASRINKVSSQNDLVSLCVAFKMHQSQSHFIISSTFILGADKASVVTLRTGNQILTNWNLRHHKSAFLMAHCKTRCFQLP